MSLVLSNDMLAAYDTDAKARLEFVAPTVWTECAGCFYAVNGRHPCGRAYLRFCLSLDRPDGIQGGVWRKSQ